MMKTTLGCFLLFTLVANGDGLPLSEDGKQVTVDHKFIQLDSSQKEEIVSLGTLTLSASQWAAAREVSPDCPKRITNVFPKDWQDCTCGSEGDAYAIQWPGNRAAIVFSHLQGDPARIYRSRLEEDGGAYLTVDERGQFYHQGVLIPYKTLLSASAVTAKPNPRETPARTDVYVDIPMGMTRDSPSLKDRLAELRAKLEGNGWTIHLH